MALEAQTSESRSLGEASTAFTEDDYKKCIVEAAGRSPLGEDFKRDLEALLTRAEGQVPFKMSLMQGDIARSIGATMPVNMGLRISNDGTRSGLGDNEVVNKEMLLSWGDFTPSVFKNPEQMKAAIAKVCRMKYADLAEPYCVSSFISRHQAIEKHHKDHEAIFMDMARKIKEKGKIDLESLGPAISGIKREQIVANVQTIGNSVYLHLGDVSTSDPVVNDKGEVVGEMMVIENGGQKGRFFAPFVQALPQAFYNQVMAARLQGLVTIINPYFFVFAGHSDREWNQLWEQKLGVKIW